KSLVTPNLGRDLQGWELELYEAAGIATEDVKLLDHPVKVERLISPGPMFSNPVYVHPELVHTWDKVGDSLAGRATRSEFSSRIFCSRRIEKRACNNRSEVEELFAHRGFEIVFPEEHSLGD